MLDQSQQQQQQTDTAALGAGVQDDAAKAAADKATADKAAADAALTPEQKAAADKATADKAAADKVAADKAVADKAKQGAPEKYEDFTAPEGVTLDADVVGEFQGLAKELNLSQADAQKVIDRLAPKISARTKENIEAQIAQTRTEWQTSTRTDKEYGGDKLQENLAVAEKALRTFGSPELSTMLIQTGLGDHPEVIRAFYKIGKAISGDRHVPGGKPVATGTDARAFYPNSTHNA